MKMVLLAPLLLAVACQAPMPTTIQPPSAEAKAQIPAASASVQNFQLRPQGKNLVWSPVSAYTAFAMLTEGAGGDTQNRLSKALDLKSPDALSALLASMAGEEVTISDAVFLRPDLKAAPAFTTRVANLYAAEALPLQGVNELNAWVAKKTKDRIPKLFSDLNGDDAAVLVNAVTFDGKWQKPFDAGRTVKRPFRREGGTTDVQMMADTRRLTYAEKDGAGMVSIPYQNGKYELLVWLPKDGTAPDPYADIASWKALATTREVDLWLPKWEMRSRHNLKPLMGQIGLGSLFDKGDFTRLVPSGDLDRISQAVQEAWIKVDESGTKAAAATGIAMAATSVMVNPKPPVVFHADRPFAYAIVHMSTNTPVFVGTLDDPKE